MTRLFKVTPHRSHDRFSPTLASHAHFRACFSTVIPASPLLLLLLTACCNGLLVRGCIQGALDFSCQALEQVPFRVGPTGIRRPAGRLCQAESIQKHLRCSTQALSHLTCQRV